MRFIAYLQPKDSASAQRGLVVLLCICATLGMVGWISMFVRPTHLGFEMAFGGILLAYACAYLLLSRADTAVHQRVETVFLVSSCIAAPLLLNEYLLHLPLPRIFYLTAWTSVLVAAATGLLLLMTRER